jgi:hypothetical protein
MVTMSRRKWREQTLKQLRKNFLVAVFVRRKPAVKDESDWIAEARMLQFVFIDLSGQAKSMANRFQQKDVGQARIVAMEIGGCLCTSI